MVNLVKKYKLLFITEKSVDDYHDKYYRVKFETPGLIGPEWSRHHAKDEFDSEEEAMAYIEEHKLYKNGPFTIIPIYKYQDNG